MKKTKKYSGVVVPMVTPFTDRGKIDGPAAVRIAEFLVSDGCCPFLLGTTGESASIPDPERPRFVETVVRQVAGRTLVYAGIAGNCLGQSIAAARTYRDLGADVAVAHLPTYYALTPLQIRTYFETLADSIPLPLVVYNIQATTHMSIPLELVEALSHHPNIVGLKDSERIPERLESAVRAYRDREDFSHFCGWASQSAHALELGSDGLVPSTGNIAPKRFHKLYQAACSGDFDTARRLQQETDAIAAVYQNDKLLGESLAALKAMMGALHLCGPDMLPPLSRLDPKEEKRIQERMEGLGNVMPRMESQKLA